MVIWLGALHGGLFSSFFGGTGLRTDRFFQDGHNLWRRTETRRPLRPLTPCLTNAPR